MKTELTYLEARINELVAYVQELKNDNTTLQHALIENHEQSATRHQEFENLQKQYEMLRQQHENIQSEKNRLQTLVDESVQSIKNIIQLLPEDLLPQPSDREALPDTQDLDQQPFGSTNNADFEPQGTPNG